MSGMSRLAQALFINAIPLVAVLPAAAEDGAWKVGSDYVIRFKHLDLSRPADRQALLVQVERSAEKVCRNEPTKARRAKCATSAVASGLAATPTDVRGAVQTARLERDGVQQAAR